MAKLNLPVHSYRHVSAVAGAERLVNCFAEQAPPEGKAPTILMRAPGIVSFAALAGGGRGLFAWNEMLYAVAGTTLYRVSSSGATTAIATIPSTSRISWATNSHQLVICSNPDAYVYDGSTVTQVTDTDYTSRGGAQCASIDNYIIFREPGTGRFFSSNLDDALNYDALDFATAEGLPDNVIGLIVDHRQLFLAGSDSIELWYNTGTTGFPFARDTNGFLEIGCAAGLSLAKADNSVFWLANDLTVRRLSGLTPVRVSQHGVEQAIRKYTISDAYGFNYTQDGHVFYVLTFPTDARTWIYDATTSEWHERVSYGLTRWRPCATAVCYGRNFVQDYQTGKIGYLDPDTYTEFDDTLRAEWTFGGVYNNSKRVFHSRLQCVVETGVGLTTGLGSDPQLMLDISDDSGRTWRALPTQSIGKLGKYKTQVHWDRLGSSFDRIYRMAVSDPVKVIVSDAQIEVS